MLGAGISEIGGEIRTLTLDEPTAPKDGEIIVAVDAAGVGNWDDLARIGSWQIGGPAPMALGAEAAGTVAAVGDGVTQLAVGDRVLMHIRVPAWHLGATGRGARSRDRAAAAWRRRAHRRRLPRASTDGGARDR